jgi:hypothetical protein
MIRAALEERPLGVRGGVAGLGEAQPAEALIADPQLGVGLATRLGVVTAAASGDRGESDQGEGGQRGGNGAPSAGRGAGHVLLQIFKGPVRGAEQVRYVTLLNR